MSEVVAKSKVFFNFHVSCSSNWIITNRVSSSVVTQIAKLDWINVEIWSGWRLWSTLMSDIEIYIESACYDQHWNNVEFPINSDNESTLIQLWYDQHWNNVELNNIDSTIYMHCIIHWNNVIIKGPFQHFSTLLCMFTICLIINPIRLAISIIFKKPRLRTAALLNALWTKKQQQNRPLFKKLFIYINIQKQL